jgi:hypothetical protein
VGRSVTNGSAECQIHGPDGRLCNFLQWSSTNSVEWSCVFSNPWMVTNTGAYTASVRVTDVHSGRAGFGSTSFEVLPPICLLTVNVKKAVTEFPCSNATVRIANASHTNQLQADSVGTCSTNLACGSYRIDATWHSGGKDYAGKTEVLLISNTVATVHVAESVRELLQAELDSIGAWHLDVLLAMKERISDTTADVQEKIKHGEDLGWLSFAVDTVMLFSDAAKFATAHSKFKKFASLVAGYTDVGLTVENKIFADGIRASVYSTADFCNKALANQTVACLTPEQLHEVMAESAGTYLNLVDCGGYDNLQYPTDSKLQAMVRLFSEPISTVTTCYVSAAASQIRSPDLSLQTLRDVTDAYKSHWSGWPIGSKLSPVSTRFFSLQSDATNHWKAPLLQFENNCTSAETEAEKFVHVKENQLAWSILSATVSGVLTVATGGVGGAVVGLIWSGISTTGDFELEKQAVNQQAVAEQMYWHDAMSQYFVAAPAALVASYDSTADFLAREIQAPFYFRDGTTFDNVEVSEIMVYGQRLDALDDRMGLIQGYVGAKITNRNKSNGVIRLLGNVNCNDQRNLGWIQPNQSAWVDMPFAVPVHRASPEVFGISTSIAEVWVIDEDSIPWVEVEGYFGPKRDAFHISTRLPVAMWRYVWERDWHFETAPQAAIGGVRAKEPPPSDASGQLLLDTVLSGTNLQSQATWIASTNTFQVVFDILASVGRDVVVYIVDESGRKAGFWSTGSVTEFPAEVQSRTPEWYRIIIPNAAARSFTVIAEIVGSAYGQSHSVTVYGRQAPMQDPTMLVSDRLLLAQATNGQTNEVTTAVHEIGGQKPLTGVTGNLTDLVGTLGSLSPTTRHLQTTNVIPGGGSSTFSWVFNVPTAVTGWYSGKLTVSCAQAQPQTNDVVLLTPPAGKCSRGFGDGNDSAVLDFSNTLSKTTCLLVPRFAHLRFVALKAWPVAGTNSVVSLDVGSDGTNDWSSSGPLRKPVNVFDLSSRIQQCIASCSSTGYWCQVPITVSVSSTGTVALTELQCLYDITDADGDGIPDEWEAALGLSSTTADSDGDVIPDAVEVGSDVAHPRDTDGDGIIDALDRDSDNDGLSDFWEQANGYNPHVPDRIRLSVPALTTNGGFALTLSNVLGRDVAVQVSSNLLNWVVLTNFIGLDGPIVFVDTTTPRPSVRFYRAVVGRPFVLGQPMSLTPAGFSLGIENYSGRGFALQASTNLTSWVTLTNYSGALTHIQFLDPGATQRPVRFYRAVLQ